MTGHIVESASNRTIFQILMKKNKEIKKLNNWPHQIMHILLADFFLLKWAKSIGKFFLSHSVNALLSPLLVLCVPHMWTMKMMWSQTKTFTHVSTA